ncbi:MAG: hypothetical protein K6D59_01590 [Bacteroidales bacterium]|nr:hypothetical protein [Bacteroidales bacterium]
MGKYIRTLTVVYDAEIGLREIPLLRGAILGILGEKADLLYHNHTGTDTFRYAYPLIQYKRLKGKAAIVCIERGVDIVGEVLVNTPKSIRLGDREVALNVEKIIPSRMLVQVWNEMFDYRISRWIPLNTKNYVAYQALDSLVGKVTMLENLLKANLLSMLKGLDIRLEQALQLRLTTLSDPYVLYNKGVGLTAFNATFACNLSVPTHLGIGKNGSIGYGIVRQLKNNQEQNNEENDTREDLSTTVCGG